MSSPNQSVIQGLQPYQYNVTGLGTVYVNNYEYTSGSVSTAYNTFMQTLLTILDKRANANAVPPVTYTPTAADYTAITEAIAGLTSLAKNGLSGDPILPGTFFLTADMANSAGLVLQSLNAVGFGTTVVPNPTPAQIEQILLWQSLASFGIEKLMTSAVQSSIGATRSLQSMIELEYVKTGNDYIFTNLGNMEEALRTTESILNTLTIVQNIINQITVSPKGNFAFPPVNSSQIPSGALANLNARGMSGNVDALKTDAQILSLITTDTATADQIINGIQTGSPNTFATLLRGILDGPASADKTTVTNIINNINNNGGSPPVYANPQVTLANVVATANSSLPVRVGQRVDLGIGGPVDLGEAFPARQLIMSVPSLAAAALSDFKANPNNAYNFIGTVNRTFTQAYADDVAAANAYVSAHPPGTVTFQSAMALQRRAATIIKLASDNLEQFVQLYKIVGSAQFTQLFPTATPTEDAASTLLGAYQSLTTQLVSLQKQKGQSISTQNSLAYFIDQVKKDISAHMMGLDLTGKTPAQIKQIYSAAVSSYIIDNQNQKLSTSTGFQAGSIQAHVTNAITSAESLNTQQKINVNNYQFIFQSFYQSASDVLSKVSQIIESLANSISKQ
jgi:predicted GNAT family acetyltransferase